MRTFFLCSFLFLALSAFAQTINLKEYFYPLDSLTGEGKTYVYQRVSDGDTTIVYDQFLYQQDGFLVNYMYDFNFHFSIETKLLTTRKHLILDKLTSNSLDFDSTPIRPLKSKIEGGQLLKWKTRKGKPVSYTSTIFEVSKPDSLIAEWEVKTTWHGNMAPVEYMGKVYQCVVIVRESITLHTVEGKDINTRYTSRQYFAKDIGVIRMENSSKSGTGSNTGYFFEILQLQEIVPGLVIEN